MDTQRSCPQCGKALAQNAPQGLCPACLLKAGFPTNTQPDVGSARVAFTAPTSSELAPFFPQLEIFECIGQGGMGAVYRARHPALDRFIALKILRPPAINSPDFAERFVREARALARLSHPNIVTVHDYGQAGSYHYLLMEFVDGMNLRHLLNAGTISPKEALAIVPPICDALQYAHDQGVVHRDIKPENILIGKNGSVKIADFGLAKLMGTETGTPSITAMGEVMGTPHYMAPEQVENPKEVDHRADIFSLGVVFYQMLTGELPLGRFGLPSRKVQIDVRLDEIVLRALEKEPALRYQQASMLKTEVETVAHSSNVSMPNPSPTVRFKPKPWDLLWNMVVRRKDKPVISSHGAALVFTVTTLLLTLFGAVAKILVNHPTGYGYWVSVPLWALLLTGLLIWHGKKQAPEQLIEIDGSNAETKRRLKLSALSSVAAFVCTLLTLVAVGLVNPPTEPDFVIKGHVFDDRSGQPIAGARVADTLYNSSPDRAPSETWTDSQGAYRLKTWNEEHTLSASAPGHQIAINTYFPRLFGGGRKTDLDFRLLPAEAPSGFADTVKGPAFEPVIERVVGDIARHELPELINFETGGLAFQKDILGEQPAGMTASEAAELFRKHGIDATGTLDPNTRGLAGWELSALPIGAELFDRLGVPELLVVTREIKPGSLCVLVGTGPLPATYVIKTRHGRVGLLQILGFSEQPHGVKIRYKLVTTSSLPKR